jgi:molybdenum-dependent DNA-binding transcriptional regulator ModE
VNAVTDSGSIQHVEKSQLNLSYKSAWLDSENVFSQ